MSGVTHISCAACGKQFELTPEYLAQYGGQTTTCECGRELPIPSAAPNPTVAHADPLAAARQMADSGQLESALAYCQEHVVRSGSSADWCSLMGIIQQAQGDSDEAVSSFQRALYLNPSHSEAISHLISLLQERRDDAQVQRLRRRLERVAPGGPS